MQEIDNMDIVWFLDLIEYENEKDQSTEEKKVYIDQIM